MKMQAIETVVSGLNGLEGIMVERKATRRSFLRGAAKALGVAAAAGIAFPAAHTLAASGNSVNNLAMNGQDTISGLDLLRAWASGQLAPKWLPDGTWSPYTYGPLTFKLPGGWNVKEINNNGETGIWVESPDQPCGFAALQYPVSQKINSRDAALWQINQITGLSSFDAIYDDYAEAQGANGTFIALQMDQTLVAIHCLALANRGGTTLNFWVEFGSVDLFDAATEQIYLPFMCQFYVSKANGGSGGATGGGSYGGNGGYSGSDGGYDGSGGYSSGNVGDVINPNDCVYARDPGSAGDVINPDMCTVYTGSTGDDYYNTNSGGTVYTGDSGGYDSGYDSGSGGYDSGYSSTDDTTE